MGYLVPNNRSSLQPFSLNSVQVESEFLGNLVAAGDRVVIVVGKRESGLFARSGITASCPEGRTWTRIDGAPKAIASVRLDPFYLVC